MDPTVIGDSANLASLIEGLTRVYGLDILVGATVAELVRDEVCLRSVARVQVKGKTKPVDVFTFIGARNEEGDPEFLKWLETYEEGLEKFRARDFTEAKILFSRFLEFYPDDLLAKMYLDRALEYEQTPPDEAWGVRQGHGLSCGCVKGARIQITRVGRKCLSADVDLSSGKGHLVKRGVWRGKPPGGRGCGGDRERIDARQSGSGSRAEQEAPL